MLGISKPVVRKVLRDAPKHFGVVTRVLVLHLVHKSVRNGSISAPDAEHLLITIASGDFTQLRHHPAYTDAPEELWVVRLETGERTRYNPPGHARRVEAVTDLGHRAFAACNSKAVSRPTTTALRWRTSGTATLERGRRKLAAARFASEQVKTPRRPTPALPPTGLRDTCALIAAPRPGPLTGTSPVAA